MDPNTATTTCWIIPYNAILNADIPINSKNPTTIICIIPKYNYILKNAILYEKLKKFIKYIKIVKKS